MTRHPCGRDALKNLKLGGAEGGMRYLRPKLTGKRVPCLSREKLLWLGSRRVYRSTMERTILELALLSLDGG
jgi:hypothetical protein